MSKLTDLAQLAIVVVGLFIICSVLPFGFVIWLAASAILIILFFVRKKHLKKTKESP